MIKSRDADEYFIYYLFKKNLNTYKLFIEFQVSNKYLLSIIIIY